jgi:aldehyde dehydrogenase (NAD+)
MRVMDRFYINGEWVPPAAGRPFDVISPASEEPIARISLGSPADVDRAVRAARQAFGGFSETSVAERRALIARIAEVYQSHAEEVAQAISDEMGAPLAFARKSQTGLGSAHFRTLYNVMEHYPFEEARARMRLRREPVGVCGLITPWNWPMNQIACKVAPAIGAGCTMVLKPSEIAPLSAMLFADIIHEAGVPRGVFNLVNGDGPGVGQAIAAHTGVDMVSFTGSTRAGIAVAKAAADSVKRVHQELGGKSPNLILDEAVLERAVVGGTEECFSNSGQSCNAPTRMLVPRALEARAAEIAGAVAARTRAGDPRDPESVIGPVVSRPQFDKIQRLIKSGGDEGARLVAGGPGRPEGLVRGFYVRPTVFSGVTRAMTIAKEEIFGPVLAIMPYDSLEEAIEIANDTPYGLAAYLYGSDAARVAGVADRLRAGMVHVNGADMQLNAPFGGYKQSGNGREWGEFGLEAFVELKVVLS